MTHGAKLAIALAICHHIWYMRTLLIYAHNVKAELLLITSNFIIIKLPTSAPAIAYNYVFIWISRHSFTKHDCISLPRAQQHNSKTHHRMIAMHKNKITFKHIIIGIIYSLLLQWLVSEVCLLQHFTLPGQADNLRAINCQVDHGFSCFMHVIDGAERSLH